MEFSENSGKINYHIHTDAIKENLIPQTLRKRKINSVMQMKRIC